MNKKLRKNPVQNPKEAKTLADGKKSTQKKKGMNPLDADAALERVNLSPAERETQFKAMTGK